MVFSLLFSFLKLTLFPLSNIHFKYNNIYFTYYCDLVVAILLNLLALFKLSNIHFKYNNIYFIDYCHLVIAYLLYLLAFFNISIYALMFKTHTYNLICDFYSENICINHESQKPTFRVFNMFSYFIHKIY